MHLPVSVAIHTKKMHSDDLFKTSFRVASQICAKMLLFLYPSLYILMKDVKQSISHFHKLSRIQSIAWVYFMIQNIFFIKKWQKKSYGTHALCKTFCVICCWLLSLYDKMPFSRHHFDGCLQMPFLNADVTIFFKEKNDCWCIAVCAL